MEICQDCYIEAIQQLNVALEEENEVLLQYTLELQSELLEVQRKYIGLLEVLQMEGEIN